MTTIDTPASGNDLTDQDGRVDESPSDRWYLVRRWFLVLAFVPALLAEPDRISADTKVYLSVDPGRLLGAAGSMWDPSVGAGTVPHQNIGYLFPLGPYYQVMEVIGLPDWIAQRLVWGALLFSAAWGVCRLGRLLGWSVTMTAIAGLTYGFSPYVLSYLARLSVILLPWAAMPWLIVLAMRVIRRPRWRTAAAFAGVIALVGSVNATSLVLAGLGPLVCVIADLWTGRASFIRAANGLARVAGLSLAVSAWWIAGLSVQGAYGLPILRFTETYRAIAGASTPAEVIRGLGYWFFYGGDRLDHWIGPSSSYTNEGWLILLGFGIAMFSLLGLLVPFPRRGTMVAMLAVGMIVSVGGAPVDAPSTYGTWFGDFAADSTIGGALRSTTRAMPLVLLALGAGLGALTDRAVQALRSPSPRDSFWRRLDPRLPVVAAAAMLLLQFFPWFIGTMTTDSLLRSEPVADHIVDLAAHLDDAGDGRVLIMPGSDFAYPRVGGTIDPVLPGVLDRPVLYRELVPQGSEATADLLNAYERRIHDGWSEPDSWPTIARLFDASAIVALNDHQYERFRLARPGQLWPDLVGVFGNPDHEGETIVDETIIPLVDSITYADPDAVESFPVVAAWTDGAFLETDERPVTIQPADAVLVLDGSGDGLVDLASSGLLTPSLVDDLAIRYRASGPDLAPASATWWVITDTNRKQARRWSTIGSNLGPIEPAGAPVDLVEDQGDQRLEVFGTDRPVDTDLMTVAEHRGDIALVQTSWTGSRIAYTPEDAPFMATDGDLATAWRTAVFDDATGLELRIELAEPTAADHVEVVQPLVGVVDRFITRARLVLIGVDGEERSIEVDLGEASRTPTGQRVDLPPGPAFASIRFEILSDNLGPLASYAGRPGVGLAELRIPGIVDDRVVRMPVAAGADIAADRSTIVMTRERIDPATQNRFAPEPTLRRVVDVPADRAFDARAELRLSPDASDETIAAVLGIEQPAIADRRLRGSIAGWAGAAVDGDPDTAWSTPIDASRGGRITIPLTGADVVDVVVDVRTDESFSIPTAISVSDGAATAPVAAEIVDGRVRFEWPDELASAPNAMTLVIDEIAARTAPEYFSGLPQELPVGITEINAFDATGTSLVATRIDPDDAVPSPLPAGLLTLDGADVALCPEATSIGDLLRGAELSATSCEGQLDLARGEHRVTTPRGAAIGLDVDRLIMDSGAEAFLARETIPPAEFTVQRTSATEITLDIEATTSPMVIVVQESWNDGWSATVDGDDLGSPELIGGYANGWIIEPGPARTVELDWAPQRRVRLGIMLSALSGIMIVALLVVGRRRDGNPIPIDDPPTTDQRPRSPATAAIGAVGLTVIGLLTVGIAPTLWGLIVGLAGLRLGTRWLAPSGVVIGIGITGAWVAVAETLRDHADSPDWPSLFSWTAPLVWAAVVGVVVSAAFPGRVTPRGEPRAAESPGTSPLPGAAPTRT